MDPKALDNMDPKLRETYQRVMGSAAPGTPTTSAPGQNSTPASPPANAPFSQSFAATPSMPIPPPSPSAPVSQPQSATLSVTPTPQPVQPVDLKPGLTTETIPQTQEETALHPLPSPASVNQEAKAAHPPSPMIRGLYITAGVIFFIVYAIFWLKIFNYPLPF